MSHLRRIDGSWVYDAKPKADLFAQSFSKKSVPLFKIAEIPFGEPSVKMQEFALVGSRWVLRGLASLPQGSSGADELPSRILFECRVELAPVIAKLIRLINSRRSWPGPWRIHWLCPL